MTRNPGKGTVLERGACLAVALIAVVAADLRGQVVAKPKAKPPAAEQLRGEGEKQQPELKQRKRVVPPDPSEQIPFPYRHIALIEGFSRQARVL